MLTHAQPSRDATAPLHPHLVCICRSLLYIYTCTYTLPHASKTRACLLGKSDGSVQLRRTWSG